MKIRIKIDPMYDEEVYFYEVYSIDEYFKVIDLHLEKNHNGGFDIVFIDVEDWFYIGDKESISKNHNVLLNQVIEKLKRKNGTK